MVASWPNNADQFYAKEINKHWKSFSAIESWRFLLVAIISCWWPWFWVAIVLWRSILSKNKKIYSLKSVLVIVQLSRLFGHYLKVDMIYNCQHMIMDIECAQERNGTKFSKSDKTKVHWNHPKDSHQLNKMNTIYQQIKWMKWDYKVT